MLKKKTPCRVFAPLLIYLSLAVWTHTHYPEEPKQDLRQWVRKFFEQGYKNLKYYWELEGIISEQRRTAELVRIVLEYGAKEVRDEIPALLFEFGVSEICSLGYYEELRAELVKYLTLRADGELEVDYPGQPGETTIGAVAYYLLRLIDKYEEVPLDMPGRPFARRNGMAPAARLAEAYQSIVRKDSNGLSPALVEYLFREYDHNAYYVFRSAFPQKKSQLAEFDWAAHLIGTTSWRIRNGRAARAELADTMQAIARLAADDAWYTRRYVVHVLLKYPFFRTPELVRKLQNDPHPLVRERAKHIKLEPAGQK